MSIDPRDQDVVFARTRDVTQKIERSAVSIDENTMPETVVERQLTTAEVIRAMTASFHRQRA